MEAALSLRGRLSMSGYETSLQEFGTSYTFRPSYMFYTDTPWSPVWPMLCWRPLDRICFLLPQPVRREARHRILTPVGDTSQMDVLERDLEGRIALIVPGAKSDDETLRRVTRRARLAR